ncbi:hypothetical protein Tco_0538041 [Tanacetum coccineum]
MNYQLPKGEIRLSCGRAVPPRLAPLCARCGTPVDGPYCQGCALLRKKFKEDLFTYYVENEFFKDLQDTSESSDDNTNVVNAPQEPFVGNQDPGENSSLSPPHIDHCCHECGDSLDGIFCQQCTCKSCGEGAHYGYNCPPKVPIISNPELPNNQTVDELPQSVQQQCLFRTCQQCGCNEYDGVCFYCKVGNGTQINVSTPYSSNDSPSVANHPPQPQYVPYSRELCGNDSHYGYDCPPQVPFVYNQDPCFNQHFDYFPQTSPSFPQQIFVQPPQYTVNHPIFNSQNELLNSSNKLMEQMATLCDLVGQAIQKKEEEKRIAEEQASKDQYWKIPICYDDDEDDTITITPMLSILTMIIASNITILPTVMKSIMSMHSPPVEIVSLRACVGDIVDRKETNTFDNSIPESETFRFNLEEISSGSPTTHSDLSLPDYKAFYVDNDHFKEKSSGSTTTHVDFSQYDSFIFDLSNDQFPPADRSDFNHEEFADELTHIMPLPELECFKFKIEPDPGDLTSIDLGIRKNVSTTNVNVPLEDDQSSLFAYVVWIFLAFLTIARIVMTLVLAVLSSDHSSFTSSASFWESSIQI